MCITKMYHTLGPHTTLNNFQELELPKVCPKAYEYTSCTVTTVEEKRKNIQCQYNIQGKKHVPRGHRLYNH